MWCHRIAVFISALVSILFTLHGEDLIFKVQKHVLFHGSWTEAAYLLALVPIATACSLTFQLDDRVFKIDRTANVTIGMGLPRSGTSNWHKSVSNLGTSAHDIATPSLLLKYSVGLLLTPLVRYFECYLSTEEHHIWQYVEENDLLILKGKSMTIMRLFPSLLQDPELCDEIMNYSEEDIDFIMECIFRISTFQNSNRFIGKNFALQLHSEYVLAKYPNVKFVVLHRPLDEVLPSYAQLSGSFYGVQEPTRKLQEHVERQIIPSIRQLSESTHHMLNLAEVHPTRIFDLPSSVWFQIRDYPDVMKQLTDFLDVDSIVPMPRFETHARNAVWHYYREKLRENTIFQTMPSQ